LHNAHRDEGGTWEWNYDRRLPTSGRFPSQEELWEDVESTTMPYLLVRGADSPIVDDDDVAELRRRRSDARVELVEEAGHSVQGDQPLVLAELLRRHRRG
jgi:pimeloyl-ACP methyl ester carboxylesterase